MLQLPISTTLALLFLRIILGLVEVGVGFEAVMVIHNSIVVVGGRGDLFRRVLCIHILMPLHLLVGGGGLVLVLALLDPLDHRGDLSLELGEVGDDLIQVALKSWEEGHQGQQALHLDL